ncbi:hypothetical protein B0H17DRAFT_1141768 [Mycena rosella]|uniref:Uncharacterized protein n=1 Tax=Mycena rosella TaxID=1033263 RepID=A0AAD7CZ50_MYCRO|nr:hypothetical protein B0H17DRAFT_1141768 [Mycena rosella]
MYTTGLQRDSPLVFPLFSVTFLFWGLFPQNKGEVYYQGYPFNTYISQFNSGKENTFACEAHSSSKLLAEKVREIIGVNRGVIPSLLAHGCMDCTHVKCYRSDLIQEGAILAGDANVAGSEAGPVEPMDPALAKAQILPRMITEILPQQEPPPEGSPRGYIRLAVADRKTLKHKALQEMIRKFDICGPWKLHSYMIAKQPKKAIWGKDELTEPTNIQIVNSLCSGDKDLSIPESTQGGFQVVRIPKKNQMMYTYSWKEKVTRVVVSVFWGTGDHSSIVSAFWSRPGSMHKLVINNNFQCFGATQGVHVRSWQSTQQAFQSSWGCAHDVGNQNNKANCHGPSQIVIWLHGWTQPGPGWSQRWFLLDCITR